MTAVEVSSFVVAVDVVKFSSTPNWHRLSTLQLCFQTLYMGLDILLALPISVVVVSCTFILSIMCMTIEVIY